jgi:hypothetical protein
MRQQYLTKKQQLEVAKVRAAEAQLEVEHNPEPPPRDNSILSKDTSDMASDILQQITTDLDSFGVFRKYTSILTTLTTLTPLTTYPHPPSAPTLINHHSLRELVQTSTFPLPSTSLIPLQSRRTQVRIFCLHGGHRALVMGLRASISLLSV